MAYPDHMLPQDVGVFFDSHDLSVLEEPLRSRIYTAMRDAPASQPLSIVSGRRSPWQQYLLRVGRVGAAHAFDPGYAAHPATALPYRSNHQRGTAVDMGGRGLDWLQQHRGDYGLGLTVAGEDWHFEVVGDPRVPITPFPNGGTQPPPTLPPEDTMAIDEATLFQLVGGAVRPSVRLAYVAGHPDQLYATNGLDFARRVGGKYKAFLTDNFNIGTPIEIPAADAAILGNIIRTSLELRGEPVPGKLQGRVPSHLVTWTGQHESQGVTERPVVLWISYAATISMALLLIVSGLTFAVGDASILGIEHLDASWLYFVSGLVGVASTVWRRLRLPWLMLLTVCTLGRAVSLVVVGSPVITDRASELRGALSWLVLWVLGAAPTIYAQASDLLRGRMQA